jgi:hypothetical protein
MDTDSFCVELANRFATVRNLLETHVSEFSELLPNVFFGDLTRLILSDAACRLSIVALLEKYFISDPTIQNLIAVSFIENLESIELLDRALSDIDAPKIRSEWHKQRAIDEPNEPHPTA